MLARWATCAFLLFLFTPLSANEEQPDSELLEYLGEWAGADKDWSDPVDILDMNFDKKEKVVTESTR